jgi:diketogulonate reductase-like aldo/keto reductase
MKHSTNRAFRVSRRDALRTLGATLLAGTLPRRALADTPILRRPIPGSQVTLPAIGMGTWITFNVGESTELRNQRLEVLRTFFELGGGMIDSSPMYGSSEDVVGYCLERLNVPSSMFSATKVWTRGREQGIEQMEKSAELWRLPRFDLMQVHNLVDAQVHLDTLLEWRETGRIGYIGITTSHGMRHSAILELMQTKPLDFVQLTYNILDREAERELLPLALEHQIAVIANRPFRRGNLFSGVEGTPLPEFAAEFDCQTWASYFLKFIISHPAITCAIPATTQVEHMRENMQAGYGRLPDADMRRRMIAHVEAL